MQNNQNEAKLVTVKVCIDCGKQLTKHECNKKMARCRRCSSVKKAERDREHAIKDGVIKPCSSAEPRWMAASRRIKARFKANRKYYEECGDPV